MAKPRRIVIPDEYVLHRPVDRVLELGERDDLVEPLADPRAREALERAVQLDVLAPGEVGVEARAELEQRPDRGRRSRRDRPSAG